MQHYSSSSHKARSHRRTHRVAASLATGLALLVLGITTAATAQAATATVHGTLNKVSAAGATTPFAGAAIELRDVTTGRSVTTAWTDTDGTFTLPVQTREQDSWGEISDEFSVLYNYCAFSEPSCSDYPQEWRGGVYQMSDAATFTLSDGATFDASYDLTIGATVAGAVTLADGTSANGGTISLSVDRPGAGTASINPSQPVAADGTFTIRGVPTGAAASIAYYREWSDSDPRCYSYPTLSLGTLAPGATRSGADLVEEYRPSVIAKIVDRSGQPIDFLGAVPYTRAGSGAFEPPQAGPFGTDDHGNFKYCLSVGSQVKLKFVDSLGADFGQSVSRTTPVPTTWVGTGGAHGTTEANAPIIDVPSAAVINLGTVALPPTAAPAPVITAGKVSIAGTAKVGKKLSAKVSGWKPAGVRLSYQWRRGGKAIAGATSATYQVVAADRGKRLGVTVTGRLTGAQSVAVTRTTSTVKAGTLTAKKPKIKGTARVGRKLTAKAGSWTKGTRLSYRWYRQVGGKWKKAARGTKAKYTIRAADRGKRLRVVVTGKKSGYAKASRTSARTAAVRR